MKVLLNWRYYIMTALLGAGILGVMTIAGTDNRPLLDWFVFRICLGIFCAACFYALGKLTSKWEREGKIPEFTNQKCN